MRLSRAIAPAFYPVHADLRAGRHREYLLGGGRGSAKSSFASLEMLICLLRWPDANAVVYRKVAATLRRSVFEQALWAAQTLGIEAAFDTRLDPPEMIRRDTGQRILFRGADDPAKSKSLKLAKGVFRFLWFEEASEFSGMQDIRTIRASVLRGVDRAATVLTYNPPESAASWINAEARVSVDGRLTHHSDYRMLPPVWLGESFLAEAEALRRSNERMWRHMYLGEAVGNGGQVFDNLSLRTIGGDELMAGRPLNGLDFGFAVDPDAFIRVYYDAKRRRLFVAEEFVGVRTPAEHLAAEVAARADGETVHCDSADPRMIQELRARGVAAVGAKKGPGSVREGIRFLQELSEIVIDPKKCPNAAREFSCYEYERDAWGNYRADCPDKNNHLIDAARYALEDMIRCRGAHTVDRAQLGI